MLLAKRESDDRLDVRRRIYETDVDGFLFSGWTNLVLYVLMILSLGSALLFMYLPNNKADAIRQEDIPEVKQEIEQAEAELDRQKALLAEEMDNLVAEHTGVKPSIIESDRSQLSTYLQPVLGWKDGAEYDEGRAQLIDQLGEDSRAVTEFMVENDRAGDFNYIDYKEAESHFVRFSIYPLNYSEGGSEVEYYGIAVYNIGVRGDSSSSTAENFALIHVTVKGDLENREIDVHTLEQGFMPQYVPGLRESETGEGFDPSGEYEGLTPEEILDKAFTRHIDESVRRGDGN